jgi:hypothetical protein
MMNLHKQNHTTESHPMRIIIEQAGLPESLRAAIQANEPIVWQWVSTQHYEQVVGQAGADHLWVRLKERFAFAGIEAACAGFHVYAGLQGVACTHTVGQLCRAVVLKYVEDWSYAQTATEVRSNSLARWFVGYGLRERTVSGTTLWRFEQYVQQQGAERFFIETLRQIDEDFPAERTATQVGDTFALRSQAREQSRTELLRTASQHLLRTLVAAAPADYPLLLAHLDAAALFGQEDEPPEYWLDKPARDALEERTALSAYRLWQQGQAGVGQRLTSNRLEEVAVQRWLKLLGKVLHDEFTFALDDQGEVVQAQLRSQHVKGSYAIGSVLDPDATFRRHGEQCDLGYNIQVAATTNFVREIFAQTGATPDSVGVADLVAHQKEQLGLVPPKLIYDRAAGLPKIFAQVAKASGGQTQLVAKLIDHSQRSERFGPADFTLDEYGQLTCPNGQTTSRAYRSPTADGWTFRFSAQQCQGCPLAAACRGDQVKPTRYRQVFISDYRYQQRQALAYTQTQAFAKDMALRPHIERIIAALTRYNGARTAQAYGLKNADYQVKLNAMACNLKRWHTLTIEQEKNHRYRPPPAEA